MVACFISFVGVALAHVLVKCQIVAHTPLDLLASQAEGLLETSLLLQLVVDF